MRKLSLEGILDLVNKDVAFECYLDDDSVHVKIDQYKPYIYTAIHNGHNFRDDLIDKCTLNENQRYHEEDPYTGDMIKFAPITLTALDSRYEYDLNRSTELAIYNNVWGQNVWHEELTKDEKTTSLAKHDNFYKIYYAILNNLTKKYTNCIVFDVHSYNILDRNYKNPPMFNLGTHFVDKKKYGNHTNIWLKNLNQIKLTNIIVEAKENDVFSGKGYLAQTTSEKYHNVLVLPTEVKKIYADEFKPEPYHIVIQEIEAGFKDATDKFIFEINNLQ